MARTRTSISYSIVSDGGKIVESGNFDVTARDSDKAIAMFYNAMSRYTHKHVVINSIYNFNGYDYHFNVIR